jgi:hypothetical protein
MSRIGQLSYFIYNSRDFCSCLPDTALRLLRLTEDIGGPFSMGAFPLNHGLVNDWVPIEIDGCGNRSDLFARSIKGHTILRNEKGSGPRTG